MTAMLSSVACCWPWENALTSILRLLDKGHFTAEQQQTSTFFLSLCPNGTCNQDITRDLRTLQFYDSIKGSGLASKEAPLGTCWEPYPCWGSTADLQSLLWVVQLFLLAVHFCSPALPKHTRHDKGQNREQHLPPASFSAVVWIESTERRQASEQWGDWGEWYGGGDWGEFWYSKRLWIGSAYLVIIITWEEAC